MFQGPLLLVDLVAFILVLWLLFSGDGGFHPPTRPA